MADNPFSMPFHKSEDPGPPNPKHLMHLTYASTRAICCLVLYATAVLGLLGRTILTELPNLLTEQRAATANDWEAELITLVLCFGAAGGLLHLFSSLGRFVGERTLQRSWMLFYYLRPPVGAVLGLFAYLTLRMGVMSPGSTQADVNVYGVLTFAALTGMFSRQAIDKFAEVFDLLFQKTTKHIEARDPRQLFMDAGRDDASLPLVPGPTPTESFKNEEPTH